MASTLLRTCPVVHVCRPPTSPFYFTTTARVWNVEAASLITSQSVCCLGLLIWLLPYMLQPVLTEFNLNWSPFLTFN